MIQLDSRSRYLSAVWLGKVVSNILVVGSRCHGDSRARERVILGREFGLCFCNRQAGVILRVVFVVGAVVGDSFDNYFRIVAACQSPFGIRPISF